MKSCTKCLNFLPLDSFSTSKEAKDGLHSWCRECVNAQRRANKDKYAVANKNYRCKNADKIRKYTLMRRADPSFSAKKAVWDRKYRQKHYAANQQRKRAYYADKQHLRRAEYQRNKQGYIARAYVRKYKIAELTPADANRAAIQHFYNTAKQLTASTGIRHEVDHIYPISKGGKHHQDNLQILVWSVNRAKGNKILERRR